MIMFAPDTLLPLPSILKKLAAVDPQAPKWILERSEQIGTLRLKDEQEFIESHKPALGGLIASGLSTLFAGMASILGGTAAVKTPAPQINEETALNHAWADVGNNMRMAIGEYICDKPFVAASVTLSDAEFDSLEILDVPLHPLVSRLKRDVIMPVIREQNAMMRTSPPEARFA